MAERKSSKSWFGVVFGSVFIVAGLVVFYFMGIRMVLNYWESQHWVQTPASILSLKFNTHRGDDSTTYSVTGDFQYQFNGQTYLSNRIALSSGSDNIGNYWRDLHSYIEDADRRGELRAWVNPDNPNEALLDRTFRWSSLAFSGLFVLMFCGAGCAVVWFSLRTKRSSNIQATDGIPSNEKSTSRFMLWFGGVFLLVGLLMGAAILPGELAEGNWPALLILLFAVAGGLLMFYGWRQGQQYALFGATPLYLDPQTPAIGGEVGAWFELQDSALLRCKNLEQRLIAKLTCTAKRRSGDNTSTRIRWQESAPVLVERSLNSAKALFKLKAAEGQPATEEWRNGKSIDWSLSVEGDFEAEGLGEFSRSWPVVISESGSTKSGVSIPQHFLDTSEARLQASAEHAAELQIPMRDTGRFLELDSAAGRNLGMHVILVLIGAVFAASGWFTILQNWWPGYLFILIGGGLFLLGVFSIGSSVHVKIDKAAHMLHARRWLYGIPISNRECAVFRADQFVLKRTSSSTSGNKVREFYCLFFEYDGKKSKLAEHIEGRRVAEALKEKLIESLFEQ